MGDLKTSLIGNCAGNRLFFSEKDSDVSVRVEWEGQKWHFPSHKLVLCTMSEVIRTMLNTDMLEKSSRIITIKDCHPLAVKQFLKYLYIGIVDFGNWTEAVNVLKVSHKYGVQTLVNLCETFLLTAVVFSNACLLHDLSRTYSLKLLKKQTAALISEAAFVISSTEAFFHLKPKSLENFLGSRDLIVENEGSLLTSLREWAVCECSRRCMPLTRANILSAMERFLKYIRWDFIPEYHRTFVPPALVEKYANNLPPRKIFTTSTSLQYHTSLVKFIIELGAFYQHDYYFHNFDLNCVKFSVDNHVFMVGFRIVGLFRESFLYFIRGPSVLVFSRDDKVMLQFNLNSLTWTRGSIVGRDIWREMIAYLPFPIRIDPFNSYSLSLKGDKRNRFVEFTKWPRTRMESEIIHTDLGAINVRCYGPSYGITQLFILPAPSYRNMCNKDCD